MNKPDRSKLRYNKDAMREAAKRPSLPYEPGHDWYPFVITDVEETIGTTPKTNGDLVLICQCTAVADIDRAGDPTMRLRPLMRERITVPVGNPDYPGHEAPDYSYGLTEGFLLSVYDEEELPRPPRRVEGKLLFQSQEISKEDEDMHRAEVMQMSVDLAEDLYFGAEKGEARLESLRDRRIDKNDLKGRLFLGRVGPDRNNEGYTNILSRRHVTYGLPKGAGWGPAYKGGAATQVQTNERRQRSSGAKKTKKKATSRRR